MAVDSGCDAGRLHKQLQAARWTGHRQTGQNDNSVTQQSLADMHNAHLHFTDQDEQTNGKWPDESLIGASSRPDQPLHDRGNTHAGLEVGAMTAFD